MFFWFKIISVIPCFLLVYFGYGIDDDVGLKNVDTSELYDNDVFIAMKMNFNDVRSTDIKLGVLQDTDKKEHVIKAEVNSRIINDFVLYGEYLQFKSDKRENTLLNNFGDSLRFTLGIEYTF